MKTPTNADCEALNRRFGAPERIVFRPSPDTGAPVAVLANKYGACEIDLFGARVLSYRPTGQQPVLCKARKSISNFKLRAGMVIGAKVTLRGDRMYEFLDRLVNITLPRIRDFRGIPNRGFDGRGNYTFGLKDQTTFPEIDATQVPVEKGMDITICTTGDDKSARALLEMLGVPFAGRKSK